MHRAVEDQRDTELARLSDLRRGGGTDELASPKERERRREIRREKRDHRDACNESFRRRGRAVR